MIVVTIDLWPKGSQANARRLQTIVIANDGTGSLAMGSYNVAISHSSTLHGDGNFPDANKAAHNQPRQNVWKHTKCLHERVMSPTHLVLRALKAALEGR